MIKIRSGTSVGVAALCLCTAAFGADTTSADASPDPKAESAAKPKAESPAKNTQAIETVVVTAERKSESIQKVPASIQAFSAETLANSGVQSTQDLQNLTPGLVMTTITGFGWLHMRGVGNTSISAGSEPGVSVYVDGVFQPRPTGTEFQYVDIDRIEVLKGPQGVMYGKNATGGTINIISKAPSRETEGQFDVQFGRFDEQTYRGTLSGPISEGVAYGRVSVLSSKNDGYSENILLNTRNWAENQSIRGSLEFTPTKALTVRFNAHHDKDEHAPWTKTVYPDFTPQTLAYAFGAKVINDPWKIAADHAGGLERMTNSGVSMTINYDTEWARLTSITAYNKHEWEIKDYDNDGSEIDLLTVGDTRRPNEPTFQDTKFYSQEFILTSVKDDPFQWLAMGSYMHQKIGNDFSVAIPVLGLNGYQTGKITADSYSLGGQGSYAFNNGIKLTAGTRYTRDTKKNVDMTSGNLFANATQNDEKTWTGWTPKFVVDYSPTKDQMYFASVTRGFKGGGYNTTAIQQPFDQETVTNYEVGMKTTLLNGRLRFNASAFYMDYQDLQLDVARLLPSGIIITETTNAASAKVKGVEATVVVKPAANLELSGNLQLLRARFEDFKSQNQIYPAGIVSLSGYQLPFAPDTTVNVAAQYTWPSAIERTDIILRVDASYKSRVYMDPFENKVLSNDPLTLTNAHLRFEPNSGKGTYGELFVNNITDEAYYNYIQGSILGFSAQYAKPRTYGVRIGHRF